MGEGEDEGDDEGEGGELGMARSISETSFSPPCASGVVRNVCGPLS